MAQTATHARTCTHCGEGMDYGFVVNGGDKYFCGDCETAIINEATKAGYVDLDEAYEDGWYCWTSWDADFEIEND